MTTVRRIVMKIRVKMMNLRRIPILVAFILGFMTFSSYMIFFNHGPPEEILSANKRMEDSDPLAKSGGKTDSDGLQDEDNEEYKESLAAWNHFVKSNNYVSIGEVFTSCNIGDRAMVGKVILLEDKKRGGVKAKAFLNYTFESEYNGGEFHIDLKYNDKNLFDNHWDACTIDDDEEPEDRIVNCPYKPGPISWMKELRIPSYLPRGKYEAKGWISDQEDETILCGIARFVL